MLVRRGGHPASSKFLRSAVSLSDGTARPAAPLSRSATGLQPSTTVGLLEISVGLLAVQLGGIPVSGGSTSASPSSVELPSAHWAKLEKIKDQQIRILILL